MVKKLQGSKKCFFDLILGFLPPRNFFAIPYRKKVKTLFYSKSGTRSMVEWRKLRKNIVFTQNHEIGNFYYFLVFRKMKKCIFVRQKVKI